ncbi:MAG: trimeric intracellular cation channel family protein, partial [Brevundimonas sp.]
MTRSILGLTPPDLPIAEIAPLAALDLIGVAVFAATGALAAARDRHDLVTMTFFAAVTGVGGGTLRDLLIGAPVFWVVDWRYIAMCIAASVAVWLLGARPWRFRLL